MRRPLAEISGQTLEPISLAAQLEHLLFPQQIQRQGAGHHKRQIFHTFVRNIFGIVPKNQGVTSLVQLNDLFLDMPIESSLAAAEIIDITLDKLVLSIAFSVEQFNDA